MNHGNEKYLLRSMMFVPGNQEKFLLSAAKSNADALIPDVEDSVQPESNKPIAREMIKEKVLAGAFKNFKVFPRVNDRESGHLLKDVQTLTIPGVHGFVFPKAKNGQDIYFFDKLLETIEYEKKLPIGTFKIIPLIETAAAVLNAQEICLSSKRVIAIAYGCEDFITDLGGINDLEGKSLYVPRALIAMAAKATGVIPVDTVHIRIEDLAHLEENVKLARNLGFEGMLILHPRQLEIAHQYFSVSEKEYSDARDVIHLSEEAAKMDKGVAILNGKFIGPPMVLTAKKLIQRYELIRQKETLA